MVPEPPGTRRRATPASIAGGPASADGSVSPVKKSSPRARRGGRGERPPDHAVDLARERGPQLSMVSAGVAPRRKPPRSSTAVEPAGAAVSVIRSVVPSGSLNPMVSVSPAVAVPGPVPMVAVAGGPAATEATMPPNRAGDLVDLQPERMGAVLGEHRSARSRRR